MSKKIFIASDHAGFFIKESLNAFVSSLGYAPVDCGPFAEDRVDYPEYAHIVSENVVTHKDSKGILICGSGVGMSIAANKVRGIRSVVCTEPYSAEMSRAHNNTNVLCLGARILGLDMAKMIVKVWLETSFEGGRHSDRIKKLRDA
jgi:ribose 5-phosphate isomerase B